MDEHLAEGLDSCPMEGSNRCCRLALGCIALGCLLACGNAERTAIDHDRPGSTSAATSSDGSPPQDPSTNGGSSGLPGDTATNGGTSSVASETSSSSGTSGSPSGGQTATGGQASTTNPTNSTTNPASSTTNSTSSTTTGEPLDTPDESEWEALPDSPADWLWLDDNAEDVAAYPNGDFVLAGWGSHGSVTRYSTHGSPVWTYRHDNIETARATTIAIDSLGNVIATLIGEVGEVVKVSPDGALQWAKPWIDGSVSIGSDRFAGTSVAPNDEIVVATHRGVVVKFTADGEVLWTSHVDGGTIVAVATGPDGSVFVAGSMLRPDLDHEVTDTWIAALDSAGQLQWTETEGTESSDSFAGIVVGLDGNPTAVGTSLGDLDHDGTDLDETTLIQYSPSGEMLHASSLEVEGIEHPYDLTATSDGEFLTVSGLTGDVTWDAYLALYSPGGTVVRGIRLFGGGFIDSFRVAAGGGYAFVVGYSISADFVARVSLTD